LSAPPATSPVGHDASDARARLRELLALTIRLSEPLTAEDVVRIVVDQARAAVGALTALMWTVEDPPSHAKLVRATGPTPRALTQDARIPLEPWLPMGDAMLRCQPLFFESRAEFRDRYRVAEEPVSGEEPFRDLAYACLPLVVNGRAIAGVSLVFPHARSFDEEERMLLTVLAYHAALALGRANLSDHETRSRERLESLQQLTSALSSAATVEAVAKLATRVATEALGLEAGVLWATDDRSNLQLLGDYRMTEERRKTFGCIPHDSPLPAARVAKRRRPQWYENDRDLDGEGPGVAAQLKRDGAFRAYCALPLVRDDRVLGVIGFGVPGPRRFLPDERTFLIAVAEHCADAIARARLYDDARRMELRLQAVLDRLPVGILVSRPPDSALVFSNQALSDIWRTSALPSRGEDRCALLKATYPDGRRIPFDESPVTRALRGQVVDKVLARVERRDGTYAWIEMSAAPVRREDGTVEVAVATVVDVTAEKDARAAADEAGRAKDDFLALLGHELRNPLAPIVTALELMRLRGAGMLERERAVIDRQVQHLMRLVDDLLDLSRASRGGLRLERTPVELTAVIADAIEAVSPLVEERKQQLAVSMRIPGLVVDADRGRLAQVITNLLNNAAKYTPRHGHITLSGRADGDHAVLEVADDGAGIAPELLPRVFDAFTQGQQGLDRKRGGLGLGLAIARQLVVGHGGTIEAQSAGVGRGTLVIVRLPRAGAPSAGVSSSCDVAECLPGGRRRRVLLVDDNPDAAELLADALVDAGHDVRTAGDGPTALQLVGTFVPDVALVDIGLPAMDGYELAGLLRRIPSLEHTQLVAVTGYAQENDRERALASGFREHLAKPVDLHSVLGCIERVCTAGGAARAAP
jgi:signal transduction histidine kinase/ActR/RegA family two-component response regulator